MRWSDQQHLEDLRREVERAAAALPEHSELRRLSERALDAARAGDRAGFRHWAREAAMLAEGGRHG
ncbi:hypothetical protein [Gordonia iterans]